MKKINIFITLGVFVLLLIGLAQPALALPGQIWVGSISATKAAHLNAAASKFEGLLNAYLTSQVRREIPHHPDFIWVPTSVSDNLLSAASDLSSSLEEFNTALMEVYPTLSEEEQLAVRNAYSSLGLYLEDLAAETNSVFGREIFRIEYGEPISKTSNSTTRGRFITIIDDLNSDV